MKKIHPYFSLFLLATLALSGCGGGSGGGGSSDPQDGVNIQAATVSGTSATPQGGVPPINPSVNGGQFTVVWSTDNDRHNASLYLSRDTTLNTREDRRVFSQNCGIVSTNCSKDGAKTCQFTTTNSIVCGSRTVNIANFLPAIPQRNYLILRTCNGLFNKCDFVGLVDFSLSTGESILGVGSRSQVQ